MSQGNTLTCPICGNKSNNWYPIGKNNPVLIERQVIGAGRRNGGCWACLSSDRERLIYVYLKEELKIFHTNKKLKILHISPEQHVFKAIMASKSHDYVCGDLLSEGYKYPGFIRNINVLGMPFSNNSFDLIICNHVLEHVLEDQKAMKEVFDKLKNDGKAILQVPISKNTFKTYEDYSIIDPKARSQAFGQFDHVRIYGQDYTDRLSSVGFKVERINISKKYPLYGLNPDEDLFLAKK